ncbi:uncharacterized protein LOC100571633 isoform X2 [Acyrthosiphon pisum]|uniref:Uncharacterized protein n=1 Tax=Acyrthosiphon pisum TaxID=7029 RepID=A0A8R2FBN1_ACYPI|nr:uncharacterized protein LOC100571633 isoform X2 [Acyrthosiphon pisum]|eukprot:XP_008186859.1 PREDICTED: uncharacterized protein LOC100571633 isoform X2 [Acyrthosiphon pisum]
MTGRINPCSRCLIEKCIISKVDDDPRDEIINTINISQVEEESKRLQKLILKKRKEYWSSLTTKKCIQTSKTSKPIVYKLNNKNVQKKLWNTNRLNELSKPRFDYYECTEEIVRRRFRRVDISRINDLATPRRTASDVEQCNCCTVPLSMLLPRIERLSVPPRRTDTAEHVKTDEDTFSVKKSALKYVASERLKRLATPRISYQEDF